MWKYPLTFALLLFSHFHSSCIISTHATFVIYVLRISMKHSSVVGFLLLPSPSSICKISTVNSQIWGHQFRNFCNVWACVMCVCVYKESHLSDCFRFPRFCHMSIISNIFFPLTKQIRKWSQVNSSFARDKWVHVTVNIFIAKVTMVHRKIFKIR